MPFVEKYGKKFYDKFMELPDYIKGHMTPKEKEVFIEEGKPAIKRYTMGDDKVNASVEAGRGRKPSDGGRYEGVYTSTFPLSYGTGYGDYQFKVPFGHGEFRNKERIVTDPELPTVTDLALTRGIRYDPEYSKAHGKVKGPIKRRDMQLDPNETPNLDKTGLFMIPTGERTPSGYNAAHTTEFGGRSDVFPGLDKDEIFLDSLATKSGRQLMRDARLSKLGPEFEGTPRRIKQFYDGPVGEFVDGKTFWDRMGGVPAYEREATRNIIDYAIQTKFKSVAGFTDAMISDPSAMGRFVDETAAEIADMYLSLGVERHPTLAKNTATRVVRKAIEEYTSRIPYFKHPELWKANRDAMLQSARSGKLRRALDDIDLLDELDVATRVSAGDDNNLVGSDRLRELADRSLNRFGYVPEYVKMYNDNLFDDYGFDIGGAMRFLLPQEPDRAIYREQRIVDQPHKLKAQRGAHDRWISKSFDNRDGNKPLRIVKRPDDLLYAAVKFPQTEADYNVAMEMSRLRHGGRVDEETFKEYGRRMYRTAKSQLERRGVTITDDIDNELKNLVNRRIEQYKDGTLKVPYPKYEIYGGPVATDLFNIGRE